MAGATGAGAARAGGGRRGLTRRAVVAAASGAVAAGCGGGSPARRRPPGTGPGTAAWELASTGPDEAVQGYADKVSVRPGESFRLHVSTTARAFRVSAFRVGWYAGRQAALVWSSGTVAGRRQARPALAVPRRTVGAGWEPSLEVAAHGWPEGAYLLRLEADSGHQRYVPLVVRSAGAAGRTLLMHAAATWQAYNDWGGYSLYRGRDHTYEHRSLAVSFDRPYAGSGAEKFLVYERAAVVLAERLGIPLAYTTGLDVHRDPAVLRGATTAVALGHDEYWTPEQRGHVTAARDAGTNLVFLGANTCYRRVRLEPGADGAPRTVVCYKNAFHADPYLARHPGMATTDFRSGPGADPESSLTGVLYEGYPADAPYVVESPGHWVFAGTGVRRGESFPHLVGVEYDRVTPDAPTPSPIEVLAHSPLTCKGRRSYADSAYYTAPGGAGVFATGTMRWVEALMAGTDADGADHGMDARTGAFVTRATENVLAGFAAGPAARHRPAPRDNAGALYGR
ncbi:N,N-dimethylformamidase beta subunit family domain-containing protein [Actinacidiphila epipremni]|uniref:N,N-dimethylformamidase beta subunit family domain-containing protein n=1 Tax=Actinacidiphila epipremni TaxID=2053013 RepID=UPI002AFF4C8F|nr:N,N-dimethylformamidase beta subunit family domain-containing protein [Actinacidiphila epipremni]